MPGKQLISFADYRKRVMGCWMGKAIGGTLGMPHEGKFGPLDLTYYDPVPKGALPNDDLDLQVLWLEVLRRHGVYTNRIELSRGWSEHTDFPWDEYGVAMANFARGIFPPASGHHLNFFGDCMGSPIRSEIWAALAPGDPELACRLAYEDAIQDHDGEGIWGELFFAAIESAAFVLSDRDRLIEIGLSVIPPKCRVAGAVRTAVAGFRSTGDWRKTRELILQKYLHPNFTDAPQNVAFTILGWLAGKDFGDAICIAVNCGQDTDCTGATLGSILGIINPDCISEEWKKPVSRDLVLSSAMKNMNPPKTIDELTDLTAIMAEKMLEARSNKVAITHDAKKAAKSITLGKIQPVEMSDPNSILLANDDLQITAIYPNGLTFVPGKAFEFVLRFINQSKAAIAADLALQLPAGWTIAKGEPGRLKLAGGKSRDVAVQLAIPKTDRLYGEYVTLQISASGVKAEHRGPMGGAWPWKVNAGGAEKLVWQPERILWPMKGVKLGAGQTLTASAKFHFPRRQTVRILLASNGAGNVKLDGKEVINYAKADFIPASHRPIGCTFFDVQVDAGTHQIEVRLQLHGEEPKAALIFSDADHYLMIHDLVPLTP